MKPSCLGSAGAYFSVQQMTTNITFWSSTRLRQSGHSDVKMDRRHWGQVVIDITFLHAYSYI